MVLHSRIKTEKRFAMCHPMNQFLYFLMVMLPVFFTENVVVLGVSLAAALLTMLQCCGKSEGGMLIKTGIFLLLVFSLTNPLLTHDGNTVLFYLNGNRITLEALLHGTMSGMVFCAVLFWAAAMNRMITTEKYIYLFGRTLPKTGLLISMTMHYIPLLKQRFAVIHAAQCAMGRNREKTFFGRFFQQAKEFSILISYSLEEAIETADAMEERGYPGKHRTLYHRYVFTLHEKELFLWILLSGAAGLLMVLAPESRAWFYPYVHVPPVNGKIMVLGGMYAALLVTPLIMNLAGEKRWKS